MSYLFLQLSAALFAIVVWVAAAFVHVLKKKVKRDDDDDQGVNDPIMLSYMKTERSRSSPKVANSRETRKERRETFGGYKCVVSACKEERTRASLSHPKTDDDALESLKKAEKTEKAIRHVPNPVKVIKFNRDQRV